MLQTTWESFSTETLESARVEPADRGGHLMFLSHRV
jgi:hypothetical protein